jgi:hypothetical protein
MKLDFSQCKTPEDVRRVVDANSAAFRAVRGIKHAAENRAYPDCDCWHCRDLAKQTFPCGSKEPVT